MGRPTRLIDDYLDGVEDEATLRALDEALVNDPAAALAFAERIMMERHVLDRLTFERDHVSGGTGAATAGRIENEIAARKIFGARRVLAVAAALLIGAAAVAVYLWAVDTAPSKVYPEPEFVSVVDATGNLYMGEEFGAAGGQYGAGTIELAEGSAEFVLSNRVSVRLRGESRLAMHSPMSASLLQGQASFVCPPGATGFTVHLPGGWSIVDLGTAFDLLAGRDASLGVIVTDGHVSLRGPNGQAYELHAGEGRAIAPSGQLAEPDDSPWLRWNLAQRSMRRLDGLFALYEFEPDTPMPMLHGDATTATGRFDDQAIAFAGDGYATLEGPGQLSTFTLSAWVRPDRIDTGLAGLLMVNGWERGGVHWQLEDGYPKLNVAGQSDFRGSRPLMADRWQHLAATFDGIDGQATLYLDGEAIGRLAVTPGTVAQLGAASIGAWQTTQPELYGDDVVRRFAGRIDEMMILKRVMDPAQIRDLYQATQPGSGSDSPEPAHGKGNP